MTARLPSIYLACAVRRVGRPARARGSRRQISSHD